jgi:SanA protein
MPLARFLKTLLLSVTALLLLGLAVLLGANALVLLVGRSQVEPDMTRLPAGATGLVLGTAPRLAGGAGPNPFFEARMDAAAQLFRAGTVNHLLLSGDNRRADYNEPVAMREALRQRGLPDAALTLDYAGFRTLDSVVRAKKVFQLEKNVILITDDFHLPRALFRARQTGLPAVGFPAAPVPWKRSYRTRFREYFSRVRACLDVYLWKTQPHFLGDPVPLPPAATP